MQKFHLFIWLDEAEIVVHTRTVVDEDATFDFNITIHSPIFMEETTNVFG